MYHVFEITDKSGRKIRLTQERWSHILKHKGMEQKLEDIKKTLINPETITIHKHDENRRNYYIYYKERKRFIKK